MASGTAALSSAKAAQDCGSEIGGALTRCIPATTQGPVLGQPEVKTPAGKLSAMPNRFQPGVAFTIAARRALPVVVELVFKNTLCVPEGTLLTAESMVPGSVVPRGKEILVKNLAAGDHLTLQVVGEIGVFREDRITAAFGTQLLRQFCTDGRIFIGKRFDVASECRTFEGVT